MKIFSKMLTFCISIVSCIRKFNMIFLFYWPSYKQERKWNGTELASQTFLTQNSSLNQWHILVSGVKSQFLNLRCFGKFVHFSKTINNSFLLLNLVWRPYCKLWSAFFPLQFIVEHKTQGNNYWNRIKMVL